MRGGDQFCSLGRAPSGRERTTCTYPKNISCTVHPVIIQGESRQLSVHSAHAAACIFKLGVAASPTGMRSSPTSGGPSTASTNFWEAWGGKVEASSMLA